MTLKLSHLTDEELEFIRWRIWEPLRRNRYYKKEYHLLKAGHFSDFDAIGAFCKKWKLPHPIDPATEFPDPDPRKNMGKIIFRSKNWLAVHPFSEHCEPLFDDAAFVDPQNWIVAEKYLTIWINLKASKNQIEKAIKKELDEWWSDKWVNYYRGMHKRKTNTPAVKFESSLHNYIEILVNLEAPRTTEIEPALKEIIDKHQKTRISKNISRLHPNKWAEAFGVFDRIKKGWPLEEIAISERKDKKTIHKQYKKAYESIYSDTVFKERPDKPRIFREYQSPTILESYARNGEIEQHEIATMEFLRSGDCPYCKTSLCVTRIRKTGHDVCTECGKEQKTGKLYREIMKS